MTAVIYLGLEKKLLLPILGSEGHSSLFVIFITEGRVLVPSLHRLQPLPGDKLAALRRDELRGCFISGFNSVSKALGPAELP